MKLNETIRTPADLKPFAEKVLSEISLPAVILLEGELGTGKTAFSEQFIHLFEPSLRVQSPSFSLMHEYRTRYLDRPLLIRHFDFYRLKGEAAPFDTGIEPDEDHFIFLVEWPQRTGYNWYNLTQHVYSMSLVYLNDTENDNPAERERGVVFTPYANSGR